MPREKGGRGKTSTSNGVSFDPKTITTYRKVSDYQDQIDDYFEQAQGRDEPAGGSAGITAMPMSKAASTPAAMDRPRFAMAE